MIRKYQVLVNCLRGAGVIPKMHILDIKCSNKFKEKIRKNNMTFQLVPPHNHRRIISKKPFRLSRDIS